MELQTELKRKRGPGRPPDSEKPLKEFSDPWIKQKLEKTYAILLKESSDLKCPFDQYLAKFALMFYYTAGENYNHKKGQMFNKVVTLGVFYKLFQFVQNMIKHYVFSIPIFTVSCFNWGLCTEKQKIHLKKKSKKTDLKQKLHN